MGYADDYLAIVDALTAKISGIAGVNSVIFGEREHVGALKFPVVFIVPGEDTIEVASVLQQRHETVFDVILVDKKFDAEQGLREVIQLGGACYDEILKDRCLGGVAQDVLITLVDPAYSRVEQTVLHWVLLRVVVRRRRKGGQ